MADGEFCVLCGASGRPLTDGVCAECAVGRVTLVRVPPHAEVVLCPTCGSRLRGRHWERPGASPVLTAEDLAPFLEVHPEAGVRSVRWEEVRSTATVRDLLGHARVRFRGIEREVDLELTVKTVHRTCPTCSRRSGKYYTAIIQLRGGAEDRGEKAAERRSRLDELWHRILREARAEWRGAESWREELPEGWNCYFAETLAARAIARLARQRFGAIVQESASLFGRKDGQDVYRVTFCLRFPWDGRAGGPEPSGRSTASGVEQ